MKKKMRQFGAAVLAVCMMLSVVSYASAADEKSTIKVTVTDTTLDLPMGRTVEATRAELDKRDYLIEAIYDAIGGETMGDHVASEYQKIHTGHKGGIMSDDCSVESCHLYSIWTKELNGWFDKAQVAYLDGASAWREWISESANDYEGKISNDSDKTDGSLKDLLMDMDSRIEELEADVLYKMTSSSDRYIFTVTRTGPDYGEGDDDDDDNQGGTGGGGSSVPTTSTQTIKNEDGSVTTIITNNRTGVVTEITTGTNGVTATTVTDKNGNASATEVVVPDGAAEPVELPLPVKDKGELNITVPDGGVQIVIPVNKDSSGNVVVIVKPDGTEEVIKFTSLTDGGVVVTLKDGTRVKVVDKSKDFIDIDGHWAEKAIDYVAARGLFAGTGDGSTFSPEIRLDRAMMAQIVYNLEGNESHNYVHGFPDVPDGKWYSKGINWAAREDVVAGYGDGLYRPEKLLSREEVVQIFYNYAMALGLDVSKRADLSGYPDQASISGWARAAMEWGIQSGLVAGKGGGFIDPLANTTRAECAQMFMNFLERIAVN
ncbi:MAG: S-layer homology domain-containing protein [Oscillospiraceae bacterium]|nr:S-layer homology domain-containing protein [Oscillospiraceae bacterium]